MIKLAERLKSKCVSWRPDGSCAEFAYTKEKGLSLDLRKCNIEQKKKWRGEVSRGVLVKDED